LAGVGGFVLGLSTFLTFATGLIVVFLVILVTRRRPFRDAARVLGAASVGGIIALIFLRVAFHYDLLSAYRGSKHILLSAGYLHRPYLYWLIAAPVAWLSMAGLPIAGMGIRELISERPLFLVSLLVPLAAFYALPHSVTGLIPGELERTVMYAYPIAGIVAAGGIVRLAGGSRRLPVLIGILVLAAALQTVLLQYLFFTPF
jgi:hypothetical protein